MQFGLPLSLVLHAMILAWALITMKSSRDFKKPEVAAVALEIVTADELAEMRKGDERSKELEAQAAKESLAKTEKPAAKPKPTPPPPPPPPAKEEAKPDPVKDKLEEIAKAPEPPKPEPPKPEVKPEPPKPEPKPDDILKEMAKSEPKEAPKPPEAKPEPPKPPPQKAAEKSKQPVPKKPPPKVAEAQPAPKTAPVPPARKPSTFDAQQIAALIDKSPNAAPPPPSTASQTPAKTPPRPAAGARDGQGARLSQNEQQALIGRLVGLIERCWRPPTGLPDAQSSIPVLKFRLSRDGYLVGQPSVENRAASPTFQLAAEAAMRALQQCQPYDLPPDKYEGGWESVKLTFDPQGMF